MTPDTSENALQKQTIELFVKMGYKFISRSENLTFRNNDKNEVIFKEILVKKLSEINSYEYKDKFYKFSPKNIQKAINDLNISLNEGLNIANKKITNLLLYGTSQIENLADGSKKSFDINFIDFKNPENNDFYITEEFEILNANQHQKKKTSRPDLVAFINGIPVMVIELKSSLKSVDNGVRQILNEQNKDNIQNFYKFIQIAMAGNSNEAKYATTQTQREKYAIWKEDGLKDELRKLIDDREISVLDESVFALARKERILEFIENFIIFDANVKKICRYQQYFGIKNTLKRVKNLENGKRKGGLIWHTQGSGKSLTMVMLSKILIKTYKNSKIILVTDRTDLEEQLKDTFFNTGIKPLKATSGADLINKLKSGASVIITLINKFNKDEKDILTDSNIFVLVDEAHRTQGGDLHDSMKSYLPNACFIGFTGTPLLKREKSSFLKFGGEIHRYTIDDAVKDGVVVPLLYESRFAKQGILDENSLNRKFYMISRNLSDDEKDLLAKEWTKFQKIASSEQRLEIIAFDICEHFKSAVKPFGTKAMLVANSRYEAIKYHQIFEKHFNDLKTIFVISGNEGEENDGGDKKFITDEYKKLLLNFSSEIDFLNRVKSDFISGDLDLIIVVNKLLTGFDAPPASVLYIDRPLKEHNLLQAIARVNRLYKGKEYGLIVDYRGLLEELSSSLSAYECLSGFDEIDITGAVIDIKKELVKTKTFYTHLNEIFEEAKHKDDLESYVLVLADSEKRAKFKNNLLKFIKSFKLVMTTQKNVFSDDEIKEFKEKIKFYLNLREIAQIRYHEKLDFKEYEKQMRELLDRYIGVGEIEPLGDLVDIFDIKFDNEVKKAKNLNAKAQIISSAIAAVISEKLNSNPAFYNDISNRLNEIIKEYEEKRINEEEKLNQIINLKELITGKKEIKIYPQNIKTDSLKGFYDNLLEALYQVSDEATQKIAIKIDEIYNAFSKYPEWQNNSDIENEIDIALQGILWDLEDETGIKFENFDEISKTMRKIGIYHYAN
ncbi:type I restriction endonuclease subunit R [Campylobacter sp. FMV-PI01]|uniref:Type I restriction enzyme endonuclease subunit n=1 Tax=Campylobacter portucalensis TaxID=2608384 RepID=A0A6L5WHN4_9BACT|nr:HsdR family type I site-specific deoxyribonuclease [Campylobacter portucalensis]MSN96406.1 type I restriction endonuclease subunit R [Campylobacter portucalensis]